MKWRVTGMVGLLVFLLSLLSVRLVDVQYWRHSEFVEMAVKNHAMRVELQARRGDILDAAGNIFATSVPCKDVKADMIKMRQILADRQKKSAKTGKPVEMSTEAEVLKAAALILKLSPKEVIAKASGGKGDVLLDKKVSLEQWEQIEKLKLPGIVSDHVYQRNYPEGQSACHLIGYVDSEEKGKDGIEKSMDTWLSGTDGWVVSEKDARQKEIRVYRSQEARPRDGHNVVLTVDQTIQHIVEEELDAAVAAHNPAGAYAVVLRPGTGEVLAMANRPTYDPNEREHLDFKNMKNRVISDTFEPGSTFKIVTTAAGLNEGQINLESSIDCEGGSWEFHGTRLRDHGSYGLLSVRQVLQKSSNIGFAKIALLLGERRLYSYIRAFGFGQPVLANYLPGERRGTLRPTDRWSKISISRVPIGYEVAATPMQMVAAMGAVANGGSYMRPFLVREVRNADGETLARFGPRQVAQVVRKEAAASVIEALEGVVCKEGTAVAAKVEGFRVAGKTGTSRKWDAEAKQYSTKRYLASFIGFLPAEAPQFVALVMVDEPSGKQYYGGQVAAPVFSRMSSRIARHLNLRPAFPEAPLEVALR